MTAGYERARPLRPVAEPIDRERLEIARRVHDPFEVVDSFYTAAWSALEVGRYEEVVALADEFHARELEIPPLGSIALSALANVPLGNWDEALVAQQYVRDATSGDHPSPPSFASGGYGAEALILEAREERGASDERLAEIEVWTAEELPRRWPLPLAAVAHARRGDFAMARHLLALLSDGRATVAVYRVRELEARAALIVEEGAWHEADDVIIAARRHAEEGKLIALPLHADRLEGHLLASRGEFTAARTSFERALAGFASLNARWEAAQTELALGGTLLELGERDAAAPLLERAAATFERLRVPRELERARALADGR